MKYRQAIFLAFLILAPTCIAQAQEFSADIRGTENGQPMAVDENPYKRLYVSRGRLRVEGERDHPFVIIIDKDVAWELYPSSKTYRTGFGWGEFVRTFVLPGNVDAICHRETSAKCGMTGRRHVQGRTAVGFSYIDHTGNRELGWIDEKLGALLKYVEIDKKRGRTDTIELVDIREVQQPDELFKMPDDYRRIADPEPPAEPHQQ